MCPGAFEHDELAPCLLGEQLPAGERCDLVVLTVDDERRDRDAFRPLAELFGSSLTDATSVSSTSGAVSSAHRCSRRVAWWSAAR